MADSKSSESAITAQTGPLQPTITAHMGGVAVVPQLHSCHIEGSVNINVSTSSAPVLKSDICIKTVSDKLKSNLRKSFGSISEGIAKKGTPALLNDIYTKLYIIQGERERINNEHEVWELDSVFESETSQDTPINLNDIFKPLPDENEDFRVVLTKGIAGIGKTVSVHKFILDWTEEKANQDVDLMIVLPFRDLNTMIEDDGGYSLQELLEEFCPELRDVKDPNKYDGYKILFIFDGLDESRLPLDFHNNKRTSNVTRKCSVDVLITNLIKGQLLSSAYIWITSRPAAIHKVSNWIPHRLTEIQGFSDPQKEEYFRKKITDPILADRVISHIKTSKSLHIMCHIPVFCWISATVFSIPEILDTAPENIPTSLTAMYTRFLLHQMQKKNEKYYGKHNTVPLSKTDMSVILKLGELAFANLEKQNLVFSESDLSKHDIDVTDVSIQSGVFTEIFKEEDPTIREKWYSFVHLTIQEYLAAFHAFYLFASEGSNPFPPQKRSRYEYDYDDDSEESVKQSGNTEEDEFSDDDDDDSSDEYATSEDDEEYSDEDDIQQTASRPMKSLHELQKAAIRKALKSPNGHLDLFLRFLLGLSVDESLWRHFKLKITKDQKSIEETVQYIKIKVIMMKESMLPSPERCFNLFHCLSELKDESLLKEIQKFMTSMNLSTQKISAAQCTALAYMISTSDEVMEEFDLKKYNTSREGQRRLIPVLGRCIRAKLVDCILNEKCCKAVAQVLQCNSSHLRELDLSHNDLGEPAVDALAHGLKNSHRSLTSLDLSFVDLEKTGPVLLKAILLGSHQPHTLCLRGCKLKQDICDTLAEAMEMPSSQLKKLDLSYNPLTDAGVETVLQGLLSETCVLEMLRLCACYITEMCCVTLAKVLQHSSLRELDLSGNNLRDEGVKLVCTGLMSPHCRLNTLGLKDCNLFKGSCAALAPVLWSFSELKDLDMSDNDLLDAGVRRLSAGLRNPNCSLRVLRMSGCQVTERGCALLASALIRNPHHLEELDLSYNHPAESGIQLLSARKQDQHCHLQKLNMEQLGERCLKWGLKKYAVNLTFHSLVHVLEIKSREIRMCDIGSERAGLNIYGCASGVSDDDLSTLHHPHMLGVVLSSNRKKATKSTSPRQQGLDLFTFFATGDLMTGLESLRQVECVPYLSGARFYWEMDWTGGGYIGVRHHRTLRHERTPTNSVRRFLTDSQFDHHFLICHPSLSSGTSRVIPDPQRVGVYLDWPAGTVSFYSVSSRERIWLQTIHTTFSAPVTPYFAFGPDPYDSSITLLSQ
ncbi:NACHT, LRR and PYD domains-containing protein 3-like [Alosa pseudoharengus]|uniref:NACHT, LRR and PYD domains-containing protein 3-like n=1 Tax=Alosa pseudoharengus TaxID=34774 RepID=UPI003F8C3357